MAAKGHGSAKGPEAKAIAAEESGSSAHTRFNAPTRLTGAEIIWATLVGEGVDTVFGYPGGAILPAYDALRKFPMRHMLVRHEQGAAHMADGYARASGKVGVAIATSGPGSTNLVTGIATAMLDSIPMVCITAQRVIQVAGNRCVSGSGHYRHYAARHQAQLSGESRRGHCADDPPCISDCAQRPSRAGARRHHQGCAEINSAIFDFDAAKPRPTARIPCCT